MCNILKNARYIDTQMDKQVEDYEIYWGHSDYGATLDEITRSIPELEVELANLPPAADNFYVSGMDEPVTLREYIRRIIMVKKARQIYGSIIGRQLFFALGFPLPWAVRC